MKIVFKSEQRACKETFEPRKNLVEKNKDSDEIEELVIGLNNDLKWILN